MREGAQGAVTRSLKAFAATPKGEYVVEYRIDGGGEVVQHPGDVIEDVVDPGVPHVGPIAVNGQEPLCMERGPADKECDDDGH